MTFASPLLTRTAIAFTFLFLAVYALTFFDVRLLYGVSVWEKPSKFFLSLAIHMATLAWGISLLPAEQQRSRGIRIASLAFLAAAVFEMAFMTYQSSLGEASHFNRSTPFHEMMYGLMGLGALTLTVTTAYLDCKTDGPEGPQGVIYGVVVGFYFGSSASSQQKDVLLHQSQPVR